MDHKTCRFRVAYTLVELSVVLMIVAVVLGGAIAILSAALENQSYNKTVAKMEILTQAIHDYRIAYNRVPCPADNVSYAVTDANFGVEAATTGNCKGGAPAAELGDSTAAVGMVPVRTLGLPDDMAFDMWGRRIRYAVAPAFTAEDAFDSITVTNTTDRITVQNNESDAVVTDKGVFVIISYGENGHGGRGAMTGTLLNSGITNSNELLNCKCDNTGAANSGADMDVFIQGRPIPDPADPLNHFDDIVMFESRSQMRDAGE